MDKIEQLRDSFQSATNTITEIIDINRRGTLGEEVVEELTNALGRYFIDIAMIQAISTQLEGDVFGN